MRGSIMASQSSMLHIRIDDDIKTKATLALDTMGLSMSDAVRLLLKRIINDQAFPLELKVPNATTRAAMVEADDILINQSARFTNARELIADLEKNSR
jgi:DNA-damage-inducible protein J